MPGFARSYGSALKARPTFGLLEAAQSAALCFFPALDKDERYVTEIRNKIDGGGVSIRVEEGLEHPMHGNINAWHGR